MSRTVTMPSRRYFASSPASASERRARMRSFSARMPVRMRYSSALAVSLTSSSERMLLPMSVSSAVSDRSPRTMSASSGSPSPNACTALYAVRAERSSAAAASSSPQVSEAPFAARARLSPGSGKGSTLPHPNLYNASSASAVSESRRSASARSQAGSSRTSARFVAPSAAPFATAARILFSSSFSQILPSISYPCGAARRPMI